MIEITTSLVRRLIDSQFPKWRMLPISPVKNGGHDNRTYRLGDMLAIRLPSHARYGSAVEKEMTWLPRFERQLSLPIPVPVAMGRPSAAYPFPWSVARWLEGEMPTHANVGDLNVFALDLAGFLRELTQIDATGGIPAGKQNFYRGGDLAVYDAETRAAIDHISGHYDRKLLTEIWRLALASRYGGKPLWVHGDVAVGNLLVKDGRLCGVIDFGTMGVGDPACDLVMAWTFFDRESRRLFLAQTGRDAVNRARGWALWKALISWDYNVKSARQAVWGRHVLDVILADWSDSSGQMD